MCLGTIDKITKYKVDEIGSGYRVVLVKRSIKTLFRKKYITPFYKSPVKVNRKWIEDDAMEMLWAGYSDDAYQTGFHITTNWGDAQKLLAGFREANQDSKFALIEVIFKNTTATGEQAYITGGVSVAVARSVKNLQEVK